MDGTRFPKQMREINGKSINNYLTRACVPHFALISGGLVQGHDADPAHGAPKHGHEGRQALVNYTRCHPDRFRKLFVRCLEPARQGAAGGYADRPPPSGSLSIAICEPVARQV